jgi:hypothetical protein
MLGRADKIITNANMAYLDAMLCVISHIDGPLSQFIELQIGNLTLTLVTNGVAFLSSSI